MTSDEARDLFGEALEGELDQDRQKAFDEAIAQDEGLGHEWREFVETFRTIDRIAEAEEQEAPDLLRGVQERLRKRSRGRFYRDRFAERAGAGWMPLVIGAAMLIVLGVAWILLSTTVVEEPTHPRPEQTQR